MNSRATRSSFIGGMLREALLLTAFVLVAAAVSWTVRSPRLPLIAEIRDYEMDLDFPVLSAEHCVDLYEAGSHLFIDTRGLAEPALYVPGALFISLDHFDVDLREVFDFIYPEDALLLYGDGSLQTTAAVAARFEERGYRVDGIMRGGIKAWRKAGGEVAVGEPSP